jgi:hypothetical protein
MKHPDAPGASTPEPPKKRWQPPRGIRLFTRSDRPKLPFRVQWLVDGQRKIKAFSSATTQLDFAKSLAADAADLGTAAYRLNPDEARAWRAFTSQIAPATLDQVLQCWTRFGPRSRETLKVGDAIDRFLANRETQGLSGDALSHARLHLDKRLRPIFGAVELGAIKPDDLRDWLDGLKDPETNAPFGPRTIAHHVRTLKLFFKTAAAEGWNTSNPALPLRIAKEDAEEVTVLSVDDTRKLFAANEGALCVGRLALEAFGGLRYSSGARLHPDDLKHEDGGVVLPGQKHKSGKRHYVEGYPDNLWRWIDHAPQACWDIHPRRYLDLKREAFVRAGLKPSGPTNGVSWNDEEKAQFKAMHNVLRHSFCSYHIAVNKDAARTAILLTHRSPSMLYQHYMGRATAGDGQAYFAIVPGA